MLPVSAWLTLSATDLYAQGNESNQIICLQALNINVDIGMPHNQLGTLAGTCSYGLDAAYHYMRW